MVTVKQQFIKDRKKLNAVVRSIEINKEILPINSRFWSRQDEKADPSAIVVWVGKRSLSINFVLWMICIRC